MSAEMFRMSTHSSWWSWISADHQLYRSDSEEGDKASSTQCEYLL